jgi:23S rRNA (cytosine1962-C5)-methyltransferase
LLHGYMATLLIAEGWRDYELLDSGDGEKLERWGQYITIRPDPRVIWRKADANLWKKAQGVFHEEWDFMSPPPRPWQISYDKIKFNLKPAEFKHTGVFPEQSTNWQWIANQITRNKSQETNLKILNLFAYTGGATMAAALAGAHVTHLDASRPAMMWASENANLTGIAKDRIRWIQDDAMKFVKREIKRGVRYDGIIMDPPRFGRGMKGEVWKLLENLPELAWETKKIMSETPRFFLLNAYTADMSAIVLENLLGGMVKDWNGNLEAGELGLKESVGGRILPAGIFARWSK